MTQIADCPDSARAVPRPAVAARTHRLTARQAEVLAFMYEFYLDNDQPPPLQVIADYFGFASMNSAVDHTEALHRRGWLARNAVGKWKFTEVTRQLMTETA